MDSVVVEEKRKLFDGIDFVDFKTISKKCRSANLESSILCKEVKDYNNMLSKQVEDYNARLLFVAEEVCVYDYVVFLFGKLFTEYRVWIDDRDYEADYVSFDFESVFEGIRVKYPGTECSDILDKYDILEFFDRIMSDTSRFLMIFYHRSFTDILRSNF